MFKDALLQLHDHAGQLAEAAGELKNQNLADIIKSGMAKLKQASEHADCEAVDATHKAAEPPPPFDPSKAQQ